MPVVVVVVFCSDYLEHRPFGHWSGSLQIAKQVSFTGGYSGVPKRENSRVCTKIKNQSHLYQNENSVPFVPK